MGTCFVIQPFDGGPFDKRYEDIFVPAIGAAELEPYRVDRDPRVSIPIEEIEAGIRASDACLADITKDNPNVWYELGYAIASQKEVVLVCSKERASKFPFDVQHRTIIHYSTDSPRDFEELKGKITSRLKAVLKKEEKLGWAASMSPIADVEGLSPHEIVALVAVAESIFSPSDTVSGWLVRQDIEKAGFTRIAATLACTSLLNKGLLDFIQKTDSDGDRYTAYSMTQLGLNWLFNNQDKLVLRISPVEPVETQGSISDDEIPF
jgi:hypothetical protein